MLSKTQLKFCKLCLSEKFYIIKSLNDPNLHNKQSEFVSTCHQSKLLLKSFKKNQYSERNDTMDRSLVFDILVVLYLMCQYVAIHPAVY